jgi:nicotinamide mononucleotide adenylyltransferase
MEQTLPMNLAAFSQHQQQAMFELLILAMYADGHLTTVEDEQLQELLKAMGYTEASDREREFDAAVTKLRPFIQSIQKAKEQTLLLAEAFTTREQQKQVYAAVLKIMTADNHVSTWENTLLTELGSKFRM